MTQSQFKYPFGREKDKPINECNKGSLKFYVKNLKLGNPKYDAQNALMAKECLLYLGIKDIEEILDEIDPSHPAYQFCHDSINAITDSKKRGRAVAPAPVRDLPVIQLAPSRDKAAVLKEILSLIDDLYKHAAEIQRLYDEYTDENVITRDSAHTPF